ncbi:MAG TPA: hypothetical protein VK854_08240 [Woeseiaceae bacterium]|nr:hypothetical protein [Woeseiaceae bacterium]
MQGISARTRCAALAASAMAVWLGGCGDTPEPAALPAVLPPPPPSGDCGERAYLRTEFYGEFSGPIDWSASELDCEGMPRPQGQGARLRFAGTSGDLAIAIIVAMPGLERGSEARELGSNVTVIEEGSGRFFGTAGLGSCWTDVLEQQQADDGKPVYFVTGRLYCIAPLAEINGDSSVTLRELQFGGYLDWGTE